VNANENTAQALNFGCAGHRERARARARARILKNYFKKNASVFDNLQHAKFFISRRAK
jgi:hypothetical protein